MKYHLRSGIEMANWKITSMLQKFWILEHFGSQIFGLRVLNLYFPAWYPDLKKFNIYEKH
jgi:hypothetical protein